MRVGILLVLVLGVVLEFLVLSEDEDEDENDDEDEPLASPAFNHTQPEALGVNGALQWGCCHE